LLNRWIFGAYFDKLVSENGGDEMRFYEHFMRG